MAKRLHDTEIWTQDWFIDMPVEYQMFWFWALDRCNHAGIWKPNTKSFQRTINLSVDLNTALQHFNSEKERVVITQKKNWLFLDFFVFQYGNILVLSNRVHNSVYIAYNQENITLGSIRGLIGYKLSTSSPLIEDIDRVKEKDKEKDKDIFFSFCAAFSFLVDNVHSDFSLDATAFHNEVYRLLLEQNYKAKKEYTVPIGRIDLVVFLEDVNVAIELDNRTPRMKSTIKMTDTGFKRISVLRNPYEEDYYVSIKDNYDLMILYKHYPLEEKKKSNGQSDMASLEQLKENLLEGK
jgi:hypothetical protein